MDTPPEKAHRTILPSTRRDDDTHRKLPRNSTRPDRRDKTLETGASPDNDNGQNELGPYPSRRIRQTAATTAPRVQTKPNQEGQQTPLRSTQADTDRASKSSSPDNAASERSPRVEVSHHRTQEETHVQEPRTLPSTPQ
jgi:hypothetical protein